MFNIMIIEEKQRLEQEAKEKVQKERLEREAREYNDRLRVKHLNLMCKCVKVIN